MWFIKEMSGEVTAVVPSDGVVLMTNIYYSLYSLNRTVIFNDMLS